MERPKRGRQAQRKRAKATVPTEQRMSIVTGLLLLLLLRSSGCDFGDDLLLSGVHEVFVALEAECLCKFVSLVMFVPGEHYISGALQAQSSSAYSSSTNEG